MTTTSADAGTSAATDPEAPLARTPRTVLGPYFSLGMPLRDTVEAPDGRPAITIRVQVQDANGGGCPMTAVETTQPEGWTRSYTQLDGTFEIRTVKPEAPEGRAPHLSVLVLFPSQIRPGVTCLYFDDESAANESDELLVQLAPEQRATMLARRVEEDVYECVVKLAGEGETTFLAWEGM